MPSLMRAVCSSGPRALPDFRRLKQPAAQPSVDLGSRAPIIILDDEYGGDLFDAQQSPSAMQAPSLPSYDGPPELPSAPKRSTPKDPRIRPTAYYSPMLTPTPMPPPPAPTPSHTLSAPSVARLPLAAALPGWSLEAPAKRRARSIKGHGPGILQTDKRPRVDDDCTSPSASAVQNSPYAAVTG